MADEAKITHAAVKHLNAGKKLPEPVVQVLGFCYCEVMRYGTIYTSTSRCIRVSDGTNYMHAFLSRDFLQNERNPPDIEDNSIIKLIHFTVSHVLNKRRILLIYEALVLQENADCVGQPVNIIPNNDVLWYPEDFMQEFFSQLDILQDPNNQTLGDCAYGTKKTEHQLQHIIHGKAELDKSAQYFKTHSYNPNEIVTPYMALKIQDGRYKICPAAIETCFRGEPIKQQQYIQVMDFREVKDIKNEKYMYILANDGLHMTTALICPFHMYPVKLKKLCLVQVLKYSCMTISNNRKCIVFHELGNVMEADCVIRFTKAYPEYCEDTQFTKDPLLEHITSFVTVMEQEGIKAYGQRSEKRAESPKLFKLKKSKKPPSVINNLPNPEKVISIGAVEKLAHAEDVKSPILQILLFKKILQRGTERYSLLLSDGYDILTALIDPELMSSVPKAIFTPYTVIQILKYTFLKILLHRNILHVHKLGYHIPVSKQMKKPIGKPVYYTCNIQHSPEDLHKIPVFSPCHTIGIVASSSNHRKLFQQEMEFTPVVRKKSTQTFAPPAPTSYSSETVPDSANLTPFFSPNKRVPALNGFCKYADRWHDKITNTTRLPDGRLIIRRPVTQRVPYQISITQEIPKKYQGKVVIRH